MVPKKILVPLEDALTKAGAGLYTNYVMLVTGVVLFSALLGLQVPAIVVPVAGCQLALSDYHKGLLSSMPFTGMMFSAFFFGFLADVYGRRSVMLVCIAINVVLTFLASVAPEAHSLMVIWFINGFILGGIYSPAYVYVSEFCPQQIRARSILIPSGFSSLSQIFLPCLAWLILPWKMSLSLPMGVEFTSWRMYMALMTVPSLISFAMLYGLPDTPKYTLNQGKEQEALEILRSMYAANNHKSKSEYPVEHLCLDPDDIVASDNSQKEKSCLEFFQTMIRQTFSLFVPPFLPYTLISIAILFGAVGAYNTLYLWFPEQIRILMDEYNEDNDYIGTLCDVVSSHSSELEGDTSCEVDSGLFLITVICASLQSALVLIISLLADRVGRKPLMIVFGGLSCAFSVGVIYADTFLVSVTALGLTVIVLSVIFPLSYSIIMNYFPTSLRSTASSITLVFGRLGVTVGSQIFGAMFRSQCVEAYWGLTTLLGVTLLICTIMPTIRMLQE